MRRIAGRASAVSFMLLASAAGSRAADVERLDIGLTAGGQVIEALHVVAGRDDAARIAIVAGLTGADAASRRVEDLVSTYAAAPDTERAFELYAIPVANADNRELVFPPTGAAYREHPESHTLWRELAFRAPDLVLVAGDDPARLTQALGARAVAGVAPIPAERAPAGPAMLERLPAELRRSPARAVIERRRARTPLALAEALADDYGQQFDPPIYIFGMALIAQLRLGNLEHVEALVAPYVEDERDSLEGRFGLALRLAGHLVFAELAEHTGDPRYLERARAAADLAFTEDGRMREAVPEHGGYSDSIFMGASILAAVGALTGERRYFDMAVRHIDFMNDLVLRDDGLYRHWPATDAAWGRGNGFAALGYVLTLSALPSRHRSRERLLEEYRALMTTLARYQNADGTWRQIVDHPGAWHEASATAIIGFAMARGVDRGWLEARTFGEHVERAWHAVLTRTDDAGAFVDVSESTPGQPTLEAYLNREAVAGTDPRMGAFAMLFAVELAETD